MSQLTISSSQCLLQTFLVKIPLLTPVFSPKFPQSRGCSRVSSPPLNIYPIDFDAIKIIQRNDRTMAAAAGSNVTGEINYE